MSHFLRLYTLLAVYTALVAGLPNCATSTSSCLWPCTTIVHLSLPTSLWTVRPTTTLCSGLAETTPTPTGTTITECFPTTAASCLPGYTPTTTTSTPSITTTSTTHTCAYGPCTTVRSMSQCVPLYAPSCQPGYTPTTTSTPTSTPTGKPQPIWGQCGGIGWTLGTVCVPGTVCTYSNPWFSQCLPA